MKILLYSPAFLPRIGGIETSQALLAERLTALGQEVTVVTSTPDSNSNSDRGLPYRVLRQPSAMSFLRAARWCDVFYQANVSLRGLWPLLALRRPWVVSHHSWYCRTDGRVAWQDHAKRYLLRFAAASIAVSHAVAADLGTPSEVIPNAYRDDLFELEAALPRRQELIFLGRLVSDKGVDLLIAALGRLAESGIRPRLTVTGDGPEMSTLWRQATELGVEQQLDLTGARRGDALVSLLNQHQILVVPSRYNEPFGIVALEGIACGCVVVGSSGGGLPEAIGPCGLTFSNGSVDQLSAILADLLTHPEQRAELRSGAAEHLARHRADAIVRRYLAVFERVVAQRAARRQR
jgi:glycogen synthase